MNKQNPFVITGKIPDEFFCDRKEETRFLTRQITDRATNILLMSERRLGKTGLIDHCYRQAELSEQFYTFYFDILHTTSLKELVFEFGKEVYTRLMPQGQKAIRSLAQTIRSLNPKFSIDPYNGMPTFGLEIGSITQPEYTLEEILNWLEHADKPCIVAIDEFQSIAKYPEPNVEAFLRGKFQHLQNCHFIFSGSQQHLLAEMFQSHKRPFFSSTTNLQLKPIEQDSYYAFAAHWFETCNRQLDSDTFATLYRHFNGNTYCIQRLLHDAFDATPEGMPCQLTILRDCLQNILENNSYSYREMLSRMSTKQKAVLTAIALEWKVAGITSAAFIRKHKLESASMVQTAMRVLTKDEWVSVRERTYSVSDPFLAEWLRMQYGGGITL